MDTILFNRKQFTPITDAPNYFICKDTAEVLLFTNNAKILKSHIANNHAKVNIVINGTRTTRTIHNLMIRQFLPTIRYSKVTHKDGNIHNNTLENLDITVTPEKYVSEEVLTDKEVLLNNGLIDKTDELLAGLEDKVTCVDGVIVDNSVLLNEEVLRTYSAYTPVNKDLEDNISASKKIQLLLLLAVVITTVILIIR
jgi:hypothetical protein